MSAPKTRHQAATRLVEFVGPEKDLNAGEVPTVRAALRKGILVRERLPRWPRKIFTPETFAKELAPAVLAQWQKSNAKFIHPVVIKEDTLARKLENVWDKAKYVARPNVPKQEDRVKVLMPS